MKQTQICPPGPTTYNGRKVDPLEGLALPHAEAEALKLRGWRDLEVVRAEQKAADLAAEAVKARAAQKAREEVEALERAATKKAAAKVESAKTDKKEG